MGIGATIVGRYKVPQPVKHRVLGHNPLGIINTLVYNKERLARHVNPRRKA
jgi:hypothetical protein